MTGVLKQGTIEEAYYVEVVDVMWVIPIYNIVKLLPGGQDIWLILELLPGIIAHLTTK